MGYQFAKIPYAKILEALESGLRVCQFDKHSSQALPDCFNLLLNPADRQARSSSEDCFADELAGDIAYLLKKIFDIDLSRVRIDIKTESHLEAGRIRMEFYRGDQLLYRFDRDAIRQYHLTGRSGDLEWNAVDILPTEAGIAKRILIVDDEPVLCAVLQRMLSRLDYYVVTARDGHEAKQILGHLDFDMVITDLKMPNMDGWRLIESIRSEDTELPVVLITGYHQEENLNRAKQFLADGYITKPFSFERIKHLLDEIWEKRSKPNSHISYLTQTRVDEDG